ncbi:acyltransferase family protein [Spirosoma litoris]
MTNLNVGPSDGNSTIPGLLKPKSHFVILDGLRGIAAFAVVIFHFMECVYPDPRQNVIGHGFLAVDFFFCLSGFVIGYAYDDRIEKIGITEFLKARLIRLHPLVILGSVLGLIAFLADPFVDNSGAYTIGKLVLLFTCSILVIPLPVMKERVFNLFGFNAPAWSLFWEYVANLVYALILCRLNRRYLAVLTILAGAWIFWISYQTGNLMGGWSKDNFWDGCARVSYSFSAGLFIYRANWIIKNKIGFLGLALLVSFAFLMPYGSWNWLAEALVVLLYFPLIISLGAGSTLSPNMVNLSEFLGKLSYPLYMTHYWAIWLFAYYISNHKLDTQELLLIISLTTVFMIAQAYIAMTLYDIPLRKYLNGKRLGEG